MTERKDSFKVELVGMLGKPMRTGGMNYVPIYINESTNENIRFAYNKGLDPDLIQGDYVRVEGYIVAYFAHNRETNQGEYTQRFVANSIERAKSDLEDYFGVEGGRRASLKNRVAIVGTVFSYKTSGRIARLGIRVQDGQRTQNILTTMFLNRERTNAYIPQRGDRICAVGEVSQRTTDNSGQLTRFENVIVTDLFAFDTSGRESEQERAERTQRARRDRRAAKSSTEGASQEKDAEQAPENAANKDAPPEVSEEVTAGQPNDAEKKDGNESDGGFVTMSDHAQDEITVEDAPPLVPDQGTETNNNKEEA